jgi:hypothetical protein
MCLFSQSFYWIPHLGKYPNDSTGRSLSFTVVMLCLLGCHKLVASSDRSADIVSESWEKICLRLPRYKKLLDLSPMAPSLERSLVDMCKRIIDFSLYITNYFRVNPISKRSRQKFYPKVSRTKTPLQKTGQKAWLGSSEVSSRRGAPGSAI